MRTTREKTAIETFDFNNELSPASHNRRELLKLGIFGGGAAFATAAIGGGVAIGDRRKESSRFNTIPNTLVRTHDGRKLRFYDDLVKGRVVTINFMYVQCGGICPGMTANLRRVQELLGDRVGRDIFMYSITLRPEQDTPEMLRAYAENFETKPGWLFLTGVPREIEQLRARLGFASRDPELDKIADEHTGMLRYGNESLDRWACCPSLARPESIVKALTSSVLLQKV